MRFVLEIEDRSIAIIDVPNMMRAAALVRSEHLGEVLRDTEVGFQCLTVKELAIHA